ncbi:hypothetical protein PVAP13_9KG039800 [Panicum virgatum]|uniref:Uncharacterized protein n=1 Tax=Panicum virgatum TaxID=38727 RepID=A0A8T0NB97_PANVG|nr:hypothetical protein PVAP13_9KG039800 [Panicum virgatum]
MGRVPARRPAGAATVRRAASVGEKRATQKRRRILPSALLVLRGSGVGQVSGDAASSISIFCCHYVTKALANLVLRSPSLPPAQIIGTPAQADKRDPVPADEPSGGGVLRQAPRRVARACAPHASPRGARGSGGWRTARGRCARTSACRPGQATASLRSTARGRELGANASPCSPGRQAKGPRAMQRKQRLPVVVAGEEAQRAREAGSQQLSVAAWLWPGRAPCVKRLGVSTRAPAAPRPAANNYWPVHHAGPIRSIPPCPGTRRAVRASAGPRGERQGEVALPLRRPPHRTRGGAAGKWPKRHAGRPGRGLGRQRACTAALLICGTAPTRLRWYRPGSGRSKGGRCRCGVAGGRARSGFSIARPGLLSSFMVMKPDPRQLRELPLCVPVELRHGSGSKQRPCSRFSEAIILRYVV